MTYEPDRSLWLKLGIAAKLAKQYGADQRDFFKSLPLMLEGSLPDETEIEKLERESRWEECRVSLKAGDLPLETTQRLSTQAMPQGPSHSIPVPALILLLTG